MKPHVHYEAALEDYLRSAQIPYVAVNEARKAVFREVQLKSFDFILYSEHDDNWLADVKGRRWAAPRGGGRPQWENWVTQDDLDGLRQWQEVFGAGFRGLLVFAYWLEAGAEAPRELVHVFREQSYIFAALPLDEYAQCARVRSPKWGTVNVPRRDFARVVRPIVDWLLPPSAARSVFADGDAGCAAGSDVEDDG